MCTNQSHDHIARLKVTNCLAMHTRGTELNKSQRVVNFLDTIRTFPFLLPSFNLPFSLYPICNTNRKLCSEKNLLVTILRKKERKTIRSKSSKNLRPIEMNLIEKSTMITRTTGPALTTFPIPPLSAWESHVPVETIA